VIDLNWSEILVLAAFAVILFGPEKLPELARKTARVLNYLRNIANDAQGRLREELGPEFADLDLATLNPKALVTQHLLDPVQAELKPLKDGLEPLKVELEPVRSLTTTAAPHLPDAQPEIPPAPVVAFDPEAT
jgi:sec-independent protein translocase protein TatB